MNQRDETQRNPVDSSPDSTLDTEVGPEIGCPIPYELRIGVTGHLSFQNPGEVQDAIKQVVDDMIQVLVEASRDPHGPHGAPQSKVQRADRILAHGLSAVTRRVCPVVNYLLQMCGAPSRWYWPVIPVSPARPTTDQQTPLKLTGISSLAKGSDQMLVDVIHKVLTEHSRTGLVPAQRRNRYVEAVLPIPQQEYEKNYDREERNKFRELLALDRGKYQPRAEPTVVYPDFPSDGRGGTVDRDMAYRAAGRYVVDTSEIVIAVWDPDRASHPGGTGAAAQYAIGRGKIVIWIDPNNLQLGPAVLRASETQTERELEQRELWEPLDREAPPGLAAFKLPHRAKALSPNFHGLAAYNRDGAIQPAEFDQALKEATDQFSKLSASKLPPAVRDAIIKHILPHLVRADLLSCRYRDLRAVAAWLWPTAAALAVSMIGFQIFFLPNQYWIAWIELAMLAVCMIAYRVSLYDAWHDKWRNDRRLAEGLRSVLHSSIVMSDEGTKKNSQGTGPVHTRVQNPLPFYSAEQSWLVGAIKRIVRKERARFATDIDWDRDLKGIKEFLADQWILGQARYHGKNARRHHRQAKKYTSLRLLVIVLIMLVSILHANGVGHAHEGESHHSGSLLGRIDLWIAFFTAVLPAWGAMIHTLSTSEDHERLAERSRRMIPLLNGLAERTRAAGSQSELQACVFDAERLFDLESQEWAESLADRRPEVSG